VMQLVASIFLIAVGLFLAFVGDVAGDMRVFGWVLAGVGLLGLVIRSVVNRQHDDRGPHGRRR
jgi:hypothetical protein